MDIFSEVQYREQYERHYDESMKLFGIPYTSRFVDTTFGQTHVLHFGDDRLHPLVLIHGYVMSSIIWYPNVPEFVKEYSVFAIDIIGDIGKSRCNQSILQHEQIVQWLHEVLNGLGLERIYLAGHSIGGYISLRYSIRYPERIKKLVLYAPAASFHRLSLKFFYYAFPGFLFHTEKWIDRAFRSLSSHDKPLNDTLKALVMDGLQHAVPLFRLYPMKIDEEQFKHLHFPILIMIGDKEILYPGEKALEYARQVLPHATLLLVEDANHTFVFEQPHTVNVETMKFLGAES